MLIIHYSFLYVNDIKKIPFVGVFDAKKKMFYFILYETAHDLETTRVA